MESLAALNSKVRLSPSGLGLPHHYTAWFSTTKLSMQYMTSLLQNWV
uniref:Uncharacterized protein n=1 Tax=Arundo donax TaxID=35708 RepID=A0A0A9GVY2_ARUDO